MPRQPLVDAPGLPPYGQRSSERRKEQNRLAQRQLRERRQQQEAAQTLKLQQQQNEIRRLNRLITELRSENFHLKNQSAFRRRQSVIPISSLSRGLIMNHVPTSISEGAGINSGSKPLFARHSIDYSSLQGPCISTFSDASHRLNEQSVAQDSCSEDEHAMSYASDFRGMTSKIFQPTRFSYDNQFCRRTLAPQSYALQDRSIKATWDKEKNPSSKSFGGENNSPMVSRQPFTSSTCLPALRHTTPPAVRVSKEPLVTSPQELERSPQRDCSSKGKSGLIRLPSVNLESFLPARPPSPLNPLGSGTDVDRFSGSACSLSGVPAEFSSASNAFFLNNRIQARKTSGSADSDTSNNTTNSIIPSSDEYSHFSTANANSVHFSFATQEEFSHYVTRSLSPTAAGSSPEVKTEEKHLSEINSTICFRSPFSENETLELNEHSTLSLPFSWNETKKFNLETLSPFPTHANSMCSIDLNDIWATDY